MISLARSGVQTRKQKNESENDAGPKSQSLPEKARAEPLVFLSRNLQPFDTLSVDS